jgi:hypothetical protein
MITSASVASLAVVDLADIALLRHATAVLAQGMANGHDDICQAVHMDKRFADGGPARPCDQRHPPATEHVTAEATTNSRP